MFISLHNDDKIPDELARLNQVGLAYESFMWYVERENGDGYRRFTVDETEFSARWRAWSEEIRSEMFLISTPIAYRMKYVLGSLCCHLIQKPIVTVAKEVSYIVENETRVRQNFIARYPTEYFAMYFCLSKFNVARRMTPARSARPGIEPLQELCENYRRNPECARQVIVDLHEFVLLSLVH
jgi:hypothetical protein